MRSSVSRLILLLILPGAFAASAPQTATLPRIVVSAKKGTAPNKAPRPLTGGGGIVFLANHPFGANCHAVGDARSPYYSSYKPTSIAGMMGGPVAAIRITQYGNGWKSPDELRATIAKVWAAQSDGAAPGAEWDEAVFTDIVGSIEFKDGTTRAFEESGGHVCFVDHNGAAIWTRVPVK
jgi:hypothetical protein